MERGLYIVPTPIGNLSDITLRAVEVLGAVDAIAAEDTRQSQRLLRHYDIHRPMLTYHDHVDDRVASAIAQRIAGGEAIALISDAGTPLISDPGYRLVRAVQDIGGPVVPLPGACAAIVALSGSGLPTDRFTFEGFLPTKSAARRQRLKTFMHSDRTVIFYEAPHRIHEALVDAVNVFGEEREGAVIRELTKTFETLQRRPLVQLRDWVAADGNQQRGEIVWLLAPDKSAKTDVDAFTLQLLLRLGAELPPRRAAAVVADVTGLKARTLYDLLSQHKS